MLTSACLPAAAVVPGKLYASDIPEGETTVSTAAGKPLLIYKKCVCVLCRRANAPASRTALLLLTACLSLCDIVTK